MAAIDPAVLARSESLDRAVEPLRKVADNVLADERVRSLLEGKWLGHPLHPMLTDLPIGFWTAAFVLDLGGRRARGAADAMVAAGVATAVPTALAGLADWRSRDRGDQRIGVVHAAANAAATGLYLLSLAHRMRGHRARGVLMGFAGAAAATAGGYLGGHLAFGESDPSGAAADRTGPADDVVDQQGAALGQLHRSA